MQMRRNVSSSVKSAKYTRSSSLSGSGLKYHGAHFMQIMQISLNYECTQ